MYNRANAFNEYANVTNSGLSHDEIMRKKKIFMDKYPMYDSRVSSDIKPIGYNRNHYGGIGTPIYKKPVNMVYEPAISKMTPKCLPVFTQPTPKLLRMPDRIELDPTKHAAYRGIDVNHYTDALGRYTAKLNLVTKPGVTGRISYKRGGILNKTRKHKEYKN